jgi:predicted extracellular nuclease/2',3'-cyclic-nucleotide 2'-phosphodiesterase (5'-nucleotidase family)
VLGLLAAPLALVAAPAQAVSADLVISEVYGAGGNSGATHNADFVELYNPTDAAVPLTGLSIQYRSQAGTTGNAFALSGSVAAGDHYLVQMSAPGANGEALTGVDATASPAFAMSGSDGQVLLLNSTTGFAGTGDVAGNAAIRDMVGYGDGAATYEGARTGVDLTSTTSAQRYDNRADTDDNAEDFSEAGPTPGSGIVAPDDRTIAEIQGTGAASPLEGDYVRTTGVVTGRYATGGYEGLVIQTGGTPDTPGASDAVFVYTPDIAAGSLPPIGTPVEVIGDVTEYFDLTEVVADSISVAGDVPAVVPLAAPWTDLDSDVEREAHESELVAPQGPFTVTDSYNIDNYGEIGLASGTDPLVVPTEVEDAQTGDTAAIAAENARRAITLDDGASINFRDAENSDQPYAWLTPDNPVRVGAEVTFNDAVLLDYRFGEWKLQPQRKVNGAGGSVASFENTRTAAPEEVGGDLRLATFNVLNFFPTTGVEFDAMPGTTCTYYRDRDGERTTVNSCNPNGPRGAADGENLARQQAKIVEAINALGASVVSLEELENSAKFGKNRDFAIGVLVDALNADAGAGTWDYVPSPPSYDRPTVDQEDVIRTGFIYKPADVERVGSSEILVDEVNFDNAREPLAQVFRPAGGGEGSEFVVVVNHFKSKGSGTNDGTGQGNANPDRIGQAEALSAFASEFAAARDVEAVFLAGDFNAYTMEDPMQVLYDDGYTNLESTTDPGEASYSFDGLSGSLDHVVANDAAEAMVTGVDVWNINAEEAVAYEYSRYNSNVTMLYDASTPYKASDHNPEVVGLDVAGIGPEDIQILATNDFHGRIANDPNSSAAGAGVMAGAVEQLREANPNTVFAAAGDLIGASTFDSFIANDKPTIDALNEAGLEVSAVGNHEFDQGYDDLVNRVMAPESEDNPDGGAEWQYLGANVKFKADGSDALEGTWIKEMDGVQVGFVGTVTEHLDELVAPQGIADIEVTDIVTATNEAADDLKAEGADVVVMLVHEGAPGTDCTTMDDDPTSDFGSIIHGVNDNVDAIVSGHTHLEYNCSFPVAGWSDREVTERPVVSAGQYGANLNKLVFTVDSATGEVLAKTQSVLKLKAANAGPANYPVDQATQAIVDAAVAAAEELGKAPLGKISAAFDRARFAGGAENRGGESTLSNLVAEVQRWATETPTAGSAQIAFMNPGGLRDDLRGITTEAFPRTVTYRQAANVQSFANTLVNMDLTGAQIKQALEQQWQPAGASRPFLRLGVSEGFEYTYDPTAAAGSRITGMWLDGEAIDPAAVYSVTANSFLAGGGDNFAAFAGGTGKQDTGQTDLQAMVDYMDEFANTGEGDAPLAPDFAQRAVGVDFADAAPESYLPGDTVAFDLSSLSMTGPTDVVDTDVVVSLGEQELGTFPVTTTLSPAGNANSNDEAGKASVSVTLPEDVEPGTAVLTVTGSTTGTSVAVPVVVEGGETPVVTPEMTVVRTPSGRITAGETVVKLDVTLTAPETTVTGDVRIAGHGKGAVKSLTDGSVRFNLGTFGQPGLKTITVVYQGTDTFERVTQEVTFRVR